MRKQILTGCLALLSWAAIGAGPTIFDGTHKGDGHNLTNLNAANVGGAFTTLNAQNFNATNFILPNIPNAGALATDGSGHVISTNLYSTNIINSPTTLTPASYSTNFVISLLPGPSGNMATFWPGNTNVLATFTGTNIAGTQRSFLIACRTNSVNANLYFVHTQVVTNANFNGVLTNGFDWVFNAYNRDTTGTNVLISPAGRYGSY